MTKRTCLALCALLLASLVLATAAAAQDTGGPPTLAITDSALGKPLPPREVAKIDAYIKFWADKLKASTSFDEINSAQKAMFETGFKLYNDVFYQAEYGKSLAAAMTPLLTVEGKGVAAAYVVAQLPVYTVQPALEAMVDSKDAGVRYWGVRGYRNAGKSLLTQGGQAVATMTASLQKLGMGETCAIVVGGVFKAFMPDASAKGESLAAMRAALDKVWIGRIKEVQTANVDFLEAYRESVRQLAKVEGEDPKAVLQLLDDVLEAGSQALVNIENPNDPAVRPLIELLTETETRLGQVADVKVLPVSAKLVDVKASDTKAVWETKVAAARLAVITDWKNTLSAKGVKPRIGEAPPKTTTASSTPASGPTTRP